MTGLRGCSLPRYDEGFGILEIVVSMFLIGLLALAFLPLMVHGITQSAANRTLATATQLLNTGLENVRAKTTCAGITSANSSVLDTSGVTFLVTRSVSGGACPAAASSYPMTVAVEIKVARTDTGAALASAKSLIFVAVP